MEGRAQILKDLEEKIERERGDYVKQVAEIVNELSSSLPNLLQLAPIFREKEAKEINNQFNQVKAELAECLVVKGNYKPTYEQAQVVKGLWESIKKTLIEEAAVNYKKFMLETRQGKDNEKIDTTVKAIFNAEVTKETDEKAKKLLSDLKQSINNRSSSPQSLSVIVPKIQMMNDYVNRRAVGTIIAEAIEKSEKINKGSNGFGSQNNSRSTANSRSQARSKSEVYV